MAKYDPTTKDNKCVFCEIVKGNIPSTIFWQDKKHIAFLSIDPNTMGFSVVIPKKHFEGNPLTTPDEVLGGLIVASKKVANILENYFEDTGRVGFIIEGMGIDHIHVKLSPMHGTGSLKNGIWQQFLTKEKEESWFPVYEGYLSSAGGPMANKEELNTLAENLKKSIK